MSARNRISDVIQKWFLREPLLFMAWTTHSVSLEPRIQTIRTRKGRIEYNPAFIDSLSKRELEAVLRSEAIRIVLKHPYTRRKENSKLAYTASNVTLQEYLRTVLPWPRARDLFGTDEFDQQYFEFYYNRLQELADQEAAAALGESSSSSSSTRGQGEGGSDDSANSESDSSENSRDGEVGETDDQAGDGRFDDLDNQDQPDSEDDESEPPSPLEQYTSPDLTGRENTEDWDSDEMLTDRINDQIRTANETQSWGTVSGKLRQEILATLKPRLDYRSVLRQFRMTILSTQRRLTRMKPSRRYGFLYMGSRRDFTTKLLFAVDVSGSISDQDLQRGFSIINQFFKYGVETIDVIQFDTEIKDTVTTLKKARSTAKVLGRGGTSFRPVLDYINRHPQYDGLIIFTDGYASVPPKPTNRRTRILWLFNHSSTYSHNYAQLKHLGVGVYLKDER